VEEIKVGNERIRKDMIKLSENPVNYGIGFQVGTKEWKILKNSDFLDIQGKKYKIEQHVDIGDYTWFIFTEVRK